MDDAVDDDMVAAGDGAVSVAVTRKALALIRRAWSLSTPAAPFDPTSTLEAADMPRVRFEDFAFRFVQAHALKRHRKGTREAGAGAGAGAARAK